MLIVRDFNSIFQPLSGMPINSKEGQDMLKKAGINVNSIQYRGVIYDMNNTCHGIGYTNVQAIKNRMRDYDKHGNHINQDLGVSDLMVNAKKQKTTNMTRESAESALIKNEDSLIRKGVDVKI